MGSMDKILIFQSYDFEHEIAMLLFLSLIFVFQLEMMPYYMQITEFNKHTFNGPSDMS